MWNLKKKEWRFVAVLLSNQFTPAIGFEAAIFKITECCLSGTAIGSGNGKFQACILPLEPNDSSVVGIHRRDRKTTTQVKQTQERVRLKLSDCLACSGCITSAETVLLKVRIWYLCVGLSNQAYCNRNHVWLSMMNKTVTFPAWFLENCLYFLNTAFFQLDFELRVCLYPMFFAHNTSCVERRVKHCYLTFHITLSCMSPTCAYSSFKSAFVLSCRHNFGLPLDLFPPIIHFTAWSE